jgi:hypothetical protein
MQRLRAAASACRRGLSAATAEASLSPPGARSAHAAAAAPEVKKGARWSRALRCAPHAEISARYALRLQAV